MKAQLLIDILSLNPEGEVYIKEWDKRKEINVQVNQFGRVELKAAIAVDRDNEHHVIEWSE